MVKTQPLAATLLAWYDREGRQLPWRTGPAERASGVRPDPYRVWISEIMLQQTRVAVVAGYFGRFTARWPDLAALARADESAVMEAWAGLGYYARVRNLHACARELVLHHGGRLPETEAALRRLPGIGTYTAAAIAAIAFDQRVVPVDGNVERVVARLYGIATPLPQAGPVLRQRAAMLVPSSRTGDFAQALMDLGAMVCVPRRPDCGCCPWQSRCRAHARGREAVVPRRARRTAPTRRYGVAFVARRADGAVLLERRPPRGLLGGMLGLPGTAWQEVPPSEAEIEAAKPLCLDWRVVPETVTHGFTHCRLQLALRMADCGIKTEPGDGWWVLQSDLATAALPTLMRKALRAGGIAGVDQPAAAASRTGRKLRR